MSRVAVVRSTLPVVMQNASAHHLEAHINFETHTLEGGRDYLPMNNVGGPVFTTEYCPVTLFTGVTQVSMLLAPQSHVL